MALFRINSREITDWQSFHAAFASEFRLFDGYGRNMDAWIDCMTDLHGEHALSAHHVAFGEDILLEFQYTDEFATRCPEILIKFVECSALVNRRYREMQERESFVIKFT